MNKLGNYVTGRWIMGDGDGQVFMMQSPAMKFPFPLQKD